MELKETVSLRERMRINLVSAMKKAGLTQVSLADRLDISKGTVNNWIRGNNSPDVDMVPRICKALGITISALYAPTYLEPVEDDCGTSLLSSEALEIAQKYDSLDRYGKNLVRLLVDEEQKRIQEERASQIQTEEFAKAIPLRLSEFFRAGVFCVYRRFFQKLCPLFGKAKSRLYYPAKRGGTTAFRQKGGEHHDT